MDHIHEAIFPILEVDAHQRQEKEEKGSWLVMMGW